MGQKKRVHNMLSFKNWQHSTTRPLLLYKLHMLHAYLCSEKQSLEEHVENITIAIPGYC